MTWSGGGTVSTAVLGATRPHERQRGIAERADRLSSPRGPTLVLAEVESVSARSSSAEAPTRFAVRETCWRGELDAALSAEALRAQAGGRRQPGWRPTGQRRRFSLRTVSWTRRAPGRFVSDEPRVKHCFLCSATPQRSADEQLSHGAARRRNDLPASGCEWPRLESRRQNLCWKQPWICCGSALSSPLCSHRCAVVCWSSASVRRPP